MDPFMIAFGMEREIYFLAKEELFRKTILRHFLYRTGMIPVKRGQSDRHAIRTVLARLSEGKIIGIFPEGTRSTDTELLDFHDGAVYFALKSGATLVPTAIVGSYEKGKSMQIVFGKAIPVEKSEKSDREQMHELTQQLATEIRALKGYTYEN
jgi:1-acyl-sn-glycerol-3-phosphate acyltransferase